MSKTTTLYNDAYNAGYRDGQAALKSALAAADGDLHVAALEQMSYVLKQHEGYIRIGHNALSGFWVRYKWSVGVHAGRYTMDGDTVLWGAIAGCTDKALAVNAGKAKATIDRPCGKR